ncbi:MAG: ATP-dependent exonuclease SbcCD, C subunit-like protein [Synergistaceae bacterium]|jgi:uncharacterized protein YPO0396|nr:ATP-dependent exonuclease SbcCD, C subunit-like protein [Synergistaceae bacterium]
MTGASGSVVRQSGVLEQHEIDFIGDDFDWSSSGFRLRRFELLNWGTFHNRIWSLPLDGKNGLLTGDIGSGKSTFMDALTTLLVPPNRIAYNKAAGADTRERTLRSYVEGYYKSERMDDHALARPVALRGPGSYTILLGCFYNETLEQGATLAQVFWIKEGEPQPERFYVVANGELAIADNFVNFGGDINNLRARLKKSGAEILDSFSKYRTHFSRVLGIPGERSEHALNLFHQAVSMKSIGNLTDFVRSHMLEPFAAGDEIKALIGHFDDLTKAHDSILKAKRQIELLIPLTDGCDRHREIVEDIRSMDGCLAALEVYFAGYRADMLSKKIGELADDEARISARLNDLASKKEENGRRADELNRDIARSGGDRIEAIKQQIGQKTEEWERRRRAFDLFSSLLESLDLPPANKIDSFTEIKGRIPSMISQLQDSMAEKQNEKMELNAEFRDVSVELAELKNELKNLRGRRTNIGVKHVLLRDRLALELNIPVDEVPFAGELLRVRPEESSWEGAAERILHNFALSVLVPEEHYRAVSDWVNVNHIGGRLVYYRVRGVGGRKNQHEVQDLSPDSLVRKLEPRAGGQFEDWLCGELASRFNYICCDDMDRFRRERMAVTKTGQVKSSEQRHEKDDRSRIDDRSRYVLGWENRSKIALLENSERVLEARTAKLNASLTSISNDLKVLQARNDNLVKIGTYQDFSSIDWQGLSIEIEELKIERDRLLETSDKLRELNQRLMEAQERGRDIDRKINRETEELATKRALRGEREKSLEMTRVILTDEALREHSPYFGMLDMFTGEFCGESPISLDNCEKNERLVRSKLTGRKDSKTREAESIAAKMIVLMSSFRREYPLETQEFDVSMRSADDYGRLLARLRMDDLPRFEAKFKELLNENTIREIAAFQAQLNSESQNIRDRIETINRSLASIDYAQGRYIKLEVHRETEKQIKAFQDNLRACTEGAITGSTDDSYSESKFQNVCSIIERFKGRPEHSDADARWTAWVTDVRNWSTFSVSEVWRETEEEYEHYADSGGKSGGQKEKLAYTILAASLAYQFGLGDGASNPRTFRFVMIDEAFGRGSDESAQFALSLFRTLNLQLLIATPLQKIHVIEPYISRVAFVRNEDGRNSCVSNMTIEQYLEEKNAARGMDDA